MATTAAQYSAHIFLDTNDGHDEMDLATSPRLNTDDIEFDIDDDVKAQDTMIDDLPDHPDADPVEPVDEDLVDYDEEYLPHEETNEDVDITYDENETETHMEDHDKETGAEQSSAQDPPTQKELTLEEHYEEEIDILDPDDQVDNGFLEKEASHREPAVDPDDITDETVHGDALSENAAPADETLTDPEKTTDEKVHRKGVDEHQSAGLLQPAEEINDDHDVKNDYPEKIHVPDLEHTSQMASKDTNAHDDATETLNEDHKADVISDIHPVIVEVDGQSYSLFKTGSDHNVLLQDTGLVLSRLKDMMAACKDNLQDILEPEHDLTLAIPSLGLYISESSDYCSKITMEQIINCYVTLCQNEELNPISPLQCKLEIKYEPSAQFAYLLQAASQHKTYSVIVAETGTASLDLIEYDDDSYDEDEVNEAQEEDVDEEAEQHDHQGFLEQIEHSENHISGKVDAPQQGIDEAGNEASHSTSQETRKDSIPTHLDLKTAPEDSAPSLQPDELAIQSSAPQDAKTANPNHESEQVVGDAHLAQENSDVTAQQDDENDLLDDLEDELDTAQELPGFSESSSQAVHQHAQAEVENEQDLDSGLPEDDGEDDLLDQIDLATDDKHDEVPTIPPVTPSKSQLKRKKADDYEIDLDAIFDTPDMKRPRS